jgi:hypothetical protein
MVLASRSNNGSSRQLSAIQQSSGPASRLQQQAVFGRKRARTTSGTAAGGKRGRRFLPHLLIDAAISRIFFGRGTKQQQQQQQQLGFRVGCRFLIYADVVVFSYTASATCTLALCLYTERMKDYWLSVAHKWRAKPRRVCTN